MTVSRARPASRHACPRALHADIADAGCSAPHRCLTNRQELGTAHLRTARALTQSVEEQHSAKTKR